MFLDVAGWAHVEHTLPRLADSAYVLLKKWFFYCYLLDTAAAVINVYCMYIYMYHQQIFGDGAEPQLSSSTFNCASFCMFCPDNVLFLLQTVEHHPRPKKLRRSCAPYMIPISKVSHMWFHCSNINSIPYMIPLFVYNIYIRRVNRAQCSPVPLIHRCVCTACQFKSGASIVWHNARYL